MINYILLLSSLLSLRQLRLRRNALCPLFMMRHTTPHNFVFAIFVINWPIFLILAVTLKFLSWIECDVSDCDWVREFWLSSVNDSSFLKSPDWATKNFEQRLKPFCTDWFQSMQENMWEYIWQYGNMAVCRIHRYPFSRCKICNIICRRRGWWGSWRRHASQWRWWRWEG